MDDQHLRHCVNNFCPEEVDLRIEGLQSEDSQLRIRFREKANKTGGRSKSDHL